MNVLIISPETIPLPLQNCDTRTEIEIDGQKVNLYDKCNRATATGQRSHHMAMVLSNDFDVTVTIPHLNYPPKEFLQDTLPYRVQSYCYNHATWDWSAELEKQIQDHDVVIVQATAGCGFTNCIETSGYVILDAWIPLGVEYPSAISKIDGGFPRQNSIWKYKFFPQFKDLMNRADYVLYANERQRDLYEGILIGTGCTDHMNYKDSKLVKCTYGLESILFSGRPVKPLNNLLWFGSIYPWYEYENLILAMKELPTKTLTFEGIRHPRYKTMNKQIIEDIESLVKRNRITNVKIGLDYIDMADKDSLFDRYDAGIIIGKSYLEQEYAHRVRLVDMISHGFPVITNKKDNVIQQLKDVATFMELKGTSVEEIQESLDKGKIHTPISGDTEPYSWKNVMGDLIKTLKDLS